MAKKLSKAAQTVLQSMKANIRAIDKLQEYYKALRDVAEGRISPAEADASLRRMKRAVRKIEPAE